MLPHSPQCISCATAIWMWIYTSMSTSGTCGRIEATRSCMSVCSYLWLHSLELRKWADAMLIAPLDANTLAKISNGLCDNLLTSVVRAWDTQRPLYFAPAMNTYMWTSPHTVRHRKTIKDLLAFKVCVSVTHFLGNSSDLKGVDLRRRRNGCDGYSQHYCLHREDRRGPKFCRFLRFQALLKISSVFV